LSFRLTIKKVSWRETSEEKVLEFDQMKTNQQTSLLQASLTISSLSSEPNDQALPSLSPSHSLGSEQDCPPALATLASAASDILKRSITEPCEVTEPAAKRVKLAASEVIMERKVSIESLCQKEKIADLVPSNSFIENAVVDLPPNPTQLEYDPAASINSFDKSPSLHFVEQLGQK
jgi:hypothetical protein